MDDSKLWCLNFCAEWTGELLKSLEENSSFEEEETFFIKCSEYHYQINHMDDITGRFLGDLMGFIEFLEKEYGWIVTYQEARGLLIDENKDYCVCPITTVLNGNVSPILCNCSAKFAQRMFSKVLGTEVKASVVRSILRDKKSCVYEIKY
jgi:hypothetical protein